MMLYMGYRLPNDASAMVKTLTFGNSLALTNQFYIDFSYQQESNELFENNYYGIAIGVNL